MPDASHPAVADLPPLREGLFQSTPPRLLGAECGACGVRLFPARSFCPACGAAEAPLQVTLSPRGSVHSWTIVRQAPGRRPTPYTLAYVDLEDGVRLLAQLDHPGREPEIGMSVELELVPVTLDDGSARLGYRFGATQQGEA